MKKSTFVDLWTQVKRKFKNAGHAQDILIALAEGHQSSGVLRFAYPVGGTEFVVVDFDGADAARFVPLQSDVRVKLEHELGWLYENLVMGVVGETEFRSSQHRVFQVALEHIKSYHEDAKLKEDYILFSLGRKLWLTKAPGFDQYVEKSLFKWSPE